MADSVPTLSLGNTTSTNRHIIQVCFFNGYLIAPLLIAILALEPPEQQALGRLPRLGPQRWAEEKRQ